MLLRPPFEVSSCVEKFREQKLNGSSLSFWRTRFLYCGNHQLFLRHSGDFKAEAFLIILIFPRREETRTWLKINFVFFFFQESYRVLLPVLKQKRIYNITRTRCCNISWNLSFRILYFYLFILIENARNSFTSTPFFLPRICYCQVKDSWILLTTCPG